jgi:mono/diheme cytochrome c family protein
VNPQQIAILVVAATLGLLLVLLFMYGRPRAARQEGIPTNFMRGDPDSVLEGQRLNRILVWGVASSILITGFLVIYFVVEPFREAAYGKKFLHAAEERGEIEFRPNTAEGQQGANCASCHGPEGEGGFAATDPNWPAPPLNNIFARYTRDEITRIIRQGRPGTPMPSWGIEFGGPLNEQKIDDIVNFIITFQKEDDAAFELAADIKDGREVFDRKCAVCHGSNAKGQGMGQPLPTFFAPDLTTEFYRLGLKVSRTRVTTELRNAALARHADNPEPTVEQIERAMSELSDDEIMDAGEEASLETIMRGRPNTPMPAWQNRIREDQINAVVAYLKSLQTTTDAGTGATAGGGEAESEATAPEAPEEG